MLGRIAGPTAPRIRRVIVMGVCGLITFGALVPLLGWELAALGGWDLAGGVFIASTWHTIRHADAARTRELATIEDETRDTAAVVVILACVVSLLAVAVTLARADRQQGWHRNLAIGAALLTVLVSWVVANTLFTLRYADAHYHQPSGKGIGFGGGDPDDDPPDYHDFAYLAFTIGMCYQVSDQTVRSRTMRRTVLVHSLVSYVFGAVIVAATINVVSGLSR